MTGLTKLTVTQSGSNWIIWMIQSKLSSLKVSRLRPPLSWTSSLRWPGPGKENVREWAYVEHESARTVPRSI